MLKGSMEHWVIILCGFMTLKQIFTFYTVHLIQCEYKNIDKCSFNMTLL